MVSSRLDKQFELVLTHSANAGRPRFTVTRALRRHRSCNRVLSHAQYVRRFFPELDDVTIKIGFTRVASGMAIPGGNEVWLNPSRICHHTISHEFVHLLQCRSLGIPQGERSCDVFSLARHWTLNDVPPSYVGIPGSMMEADGRIAPRNARLVYETARTAVEMRQRGPCHYIAFFEKQLARLAEERRGARNNERPSDLDLFSPSVAAPI